MFWVWPEIKRINPKTAQIPIDLTTTLPPVRSWRCRMCEPRPRCSRCSSVTRCSWRALYSCGGTHCGHTLGVFVLMFCFPRSEALRQHELLFFKCRGSRSGSLWFPQTVTDAQHCCDARGLLSTHKNDDTATDCSDGRHAAAEGSLVGKEQF